MIVEMRTYTLKPGSQATVVERFGKALPNRTKLSPLTAFWMTDVGPLNQIIHVWCYKDSAERDAIRGQATKLEGWPPDIHEFVVKQESKVMNPAPYSPPLEPRQLGGVYEIRTYIYKPRSMPHVTESWSAALPERIKLSPLVGAFWGEVGTLNQYVHIWAYKDAAERSRVRAEAIAKGIWPPKSKVPDILVKQENALCIPAPFSPLR
jgi:hypothetical protein